MNKQNAIWLLDETFKQKFELERFIKFITELFNKFTVNKRTWPVWKEYQKYIDSYQLLGSYKENSNKIIDVLVIKLKRTSSRDKARVIQRNFVAKYLGSAEKDAALVAFYGDDPNDWRFSFVKMEYHLVKDESGKVKPIKELTPAKRYSFLVGVNEPNHTCRSRFLNLVMEENVDPSLSDIEKAFSIDNVTKEFFDKYKKLFLELKESLETILTKNKNARREFEDKNISTVDFSKKLLGQIVFSYFLQKKGWLGVKVNEKWGTGPKDFMRQLFNKKIVPYNNFFNEILEPLFYEALATPRDDNYYSRFNCKIPFLNGGLFEPINDYDWVKTDIILDNSIFERIISTFNRFNFTVKEDEPLEKEVAVDPEMLGKVFENLLEVKDRKSKGAFYTPREIVHYMCQQSLINYLETNTSISRKDIEKFILFGEFTTSEDSKIFENIKIKEDKLKKGIINAKTYQNEVKQEDHKLNLPKTIIQNKEKIDKLLRDIKIVDPAVGSGAFLIGMLNEIVKAENTLFTFLENKKSSYDLKREIIENCLYGVDIEPSAVDISKLRFWLSLVVDELDMKNIKPLPNLDHKIMCGNSLLEEFEGIKLFDERLLGKVKKEVPFEVQQIDKEIKRMYKEKGDIIRGKSKDKTTKEIDKEIKKLQKKKQKILSRPKETNQQITLAESMQKKIKESKKKLAELKKLQQQFFNEQRRGVKKELRNKIDKLEWDLIRVTLEEQGNEEALKKLEQYKKNKAKPFFLWKLYFAEVFQKDNPGFDVVIGNPPYINIYKISKAERKIFLKNPRIYHSAIYKFDLYILFIELGINILKNFGTLSFITSNKWLNQKYGSELRKILLEETKIEQIINFKKLKVFDAATVDTNILIFKNKKSKNEAINVFSFNENNSLKDLNNKEYFTNIDSQDWKDLTPLIEFRTELNSEKLNLLKKIKEEIYFLEEIAYINYGARLGGKKYPNKNYFLSKQKKEGFNKKFVEGKHLKKWLFKGNLWLNYGMDGMYNPMFSELFESEKICVPNVSTNLKFAYDNKGLYNNQTIENVVLYHSLSKNNYSPLKRFFLKNPKVVQNSKRFSIKYVLALVNSKLMNWFFKETMSDQLHCTIDNAKQLPIKKTSKAQQKPVIKLVDQILSITKSKDYLDNPDKQAKVKRLEKEIDQLVYKLYGLNKEEIKIVEGFNQ